MKKTLFCLLIALLPVVGLAQNHFEMIRHYANFFATKANLTSDTNFFDATIHGYTGLDSRLKTTINALKSEKKDVTNANTLLTTIRNWKSKEEHRKSAAQIAVDIDSDIAKNKISIENDEDYQNLKIFLNSQVQHKMADSNLAVSKTGQDDSVRKIQNAILILNTQLHAYKKDTALIKNFAYVAVAASLISIIVSIFMFVNARKPPGKNDETRNLELVLNGEGKIKSCTEQMADLLGDNESELLDKNWMEIFIPDDKRKIVKEWLLDSDTDGKFLETKIICKNNKIHTFRLQKTTREDKNGRRRITVLSQDITEKPVQSENIIDTNSKSLASVIDLERINIDLTKQIDAIKKDLETLKIKSEKNEISSQNHSTAIIHEKREPEPGDEPREFLFDIMKDNIVAKSPELEPTVKTYKNAFIADSTMKYAKFSDLTPPGFSTDVLEEKQDGEQSFEISIIGDNAVYGVSGDPKAQSYALQNFEYLKAACNIKGTPQNNGKIVTHKQGTLSRSPEGGWTIVDKADIELK